MVSSNLIGQLGPARYLSASQTRVLGTRLACLLTGSGSVTTGGPTAGGVRSVNVWCSRSVDVVHAVDDQDYSNSAVSRYRYRTELVWKIVVLTAHASTVG